MPLFFRETYCFLCHSWWTSNSQHVVPCKLFNIQRLCTESLSSFICYQFEPCNRIEIAGDVYKENTLKESARREKIGSRTRRRVLPDSKIPGNWYSFLQTDESKDNLLEFLAVKTSHIKSNQVIVSTYEDMVVSNYSVNVSILVNVHRKKMIQNLPAHSKCQCLWQHQSFG